MNLESLCGEAAARHASDIHLVVGEPPVFRIDGALIRQSEMTKLDVPGMESLLLPALPETARIALMDGAPVVDAVLSKEDLLCRVAVYRERGRLAATVRIAQAKVPTLEQIGTGYPELAPLLARLAGTPRGLILFTGRTGSGKATTAVALVEHINQTSGARIITIEESPSYALHSKQSILTSMYIGQDTGSYEQAAQTVFHHADPDVVYLSDLPTQETMRQALILAETGHLVVANLHAESVPEAVEQLIRAFPEPRESVRALLARTLVAVFCQRLLRRKDRPGRVAAYEILLTTPSVREIVRTSAALENDLTVAIAVGRTEGMRTLSDAVDGLIASGHIDAETAQAQMA